MCARACVRAVLSMCLCCQCVVCVVFFLGGGGGGLIFRLECACVSVNVHPLPPCVCVCEDNTEHKANIAKDALIDSAARLNGAGELSLPEYKYSQLGSGMQVTRQDKTARRIYATRPGCERLRSHRRSVRRERSVRRDNHEAGSTIAIKRQSPSFHSELRSCVKVEVAVLGSRPVPNKPTVCVDVTQHFNNIPLTVSASTKP